MSGLSVLIVLGSLPDMFNSIIETFHHICRHSPAFVFGSVKVAECGKTCVHQFSIWEPRVLEETYRFNIRTVPGTHIHIITGKVLCEVHETFHSLDASNSLRGRVPKIIISSKGPFKLKKVVL